MSRDSLSLLASLTRQLRDALSSELFTDDSSSAWCGHEERFRRQTGIVDRAEFADAVAQSIACACFGLQSFGDRLKCRGMKWLIHGTDPLVADVLRVSSGDPVAGICGSHVLESVQNMWQFLDKNRIDGIHQQLPHAPTLAATAVYFYEHFLAEYDQRKRRGKGVFFTPHSLVSFVVRSVDTLLEREFSLNGGLADTTSWLERLSPCDQTRSSSVWRDQPFLRILDPAMGTGAFLLEAMARIEQRFSRQQVAVGATEQETNRSWNEYVAQHLLPRLWGQELMLPPLVLAHLAMTAWLADSGFHFEHAGPLHLYLANTLRQPEIGGDLPLGDRPPFTVVLGNPPFSGVSDNRHTWMRQLLRGQAPGSPAKVANYFRSQGKPLGERKHWLEDDYVKFMRFGHWQIETAGTGILALVTNHGYLDNSTFRGMREQLLTTFPLVDVVDLHGNSRIGERTPDNRPDESLFGIEQGVAVSLLRRPPAVGRSHSVKLADLWGDRSTKIRTLVDRSANSLTWKSIEPQAPHFFFTGAGHLTAKEYEAGFRLCDIMPTNSTAVVTARDGFVVAIEDGDLRRRMEQFADLDIPDEEIRASFFRNTRSRSYPPGDTRGWQMAVARRRLHDDPNWERYIRSCMYRPFDRRQILWATWMIDWPRNNVMQHLAEGGNLAFIARRQMPPSQPCDHFWVTDSITLDGVVRSDNRGSESVFPLLLRDSTAVDGNVDDGSQANGGRRVSRINFTDQFIEFCTARFALPWVPAAGAGDEASLTPHALFYYIYALFHCPSYRQRFAEPLRVDFPRVLVPRHRELFFRLAKLGEVLVNVHLLQSDGRRPCSSFPLTHTGNSGSGHAVESGYPKFSAETVWLNKTVGFSAVRKEMWDFRVGTYQVCRKWLKDRRHCLLSAIEMKQYGQILHAIDTTISVKKEVDQQIKRHGGWQIAYGDKTHLH